MKIRNIIFISFLFSFYIQAQYSESYKRSLEIKEIQANNLFDADDFHEAIPFYSELAEDSLASPQINLRLGICLLKVGKNKRDAIPFLLKAQNSGLNASLFLGQAYHLKMSFDTANMYFDSYLLSAKPQELKKNRVEFLRNKVSNAVALLNQPTKCTVTFLPAPYNSIESEYGLVESADMTAMYFTARKSDTRGGKSDGYGRFYEDIYQIKENGELLKEPNNVGTPINSNEHDAVLCLSADKRTMIVYRTDPFSGEGDFYVSEKKGDEWTNLVLMGININSTAEESSATLSNDGQTIYFSSNREGGYGGMDLYKSKKNKNGVWGRAINLGATINTEANEDYPFLYYDQKRLFFSSDGHSKNMGGFDIFESVIISESNYSAPENMGYPINSTDDDLGFILSANSKNGYFFSSRTGAIGQQDILKVEFPTDTSTITVLKGIVYQENNSVAKKAMITVAERNSNNRTMYSSDAVSGEYCVILEKNKTYIVTFEKENQRSIEIIEPKKNANFRMITKEINLNPF